ncbi:MAG: STAS domain-containing protein [Phycisphaerales bacterium]
MPINDWSDDILIAELADEPGFSDDLAAVVRRYDSDGQPPDVILDLRGVSYLNSSNIAQLLRLRKKVVSANRRMRVCGVRDSVWGVMMVTGLDKLFEFTDDVSTSLTSLQLGL